MLEMEKEIEEELQKLKKPENRLELVFVIGMYWRIFYGAVRILIGSALLRMVGTPISELFHRVFRNELIEDPADKLAGHLDLLVNHHAFSVTYFLAFYLIFWGVVDMFLSINMLRHKLWAFPVGIALIWLFVLYEIYRYTYTHSTILLGVIIVDIFLIWLIGKEQRKLERRLQQMSF